MTVPDLTRAACRGTAPVDGEVEEHRWFPTRATGVELSLAAEAVCATCPVVEQCLVGALERNEQDGVWGGAGEDTRRWLRRMLTVGGPAWTMALREHLDRIRQPVRTRRPKRPPSYGDGATHGRRVTHARGCRGEACGGRCSLAVSVGDDVMARLPERRRVTDTEGASASEPAAEEAA